MPSADGSLIFDTKLDINDFKKSMTSLGNVASSGMKSIASKVSGGLSGLGSSLTGALSSAATKVSNFAKTAAKTMAGFTVAAGAALAGAGGYAINLASDLTEVQNVVDVTFQDNADNINAWAKSAATAFGLSELQAKQYTGTLGAMMKSMGLADTEVLTMSKDMVGLAGDFASFYNLDPEEAFEKIRSGISGETEPLKQLGINMSVANLEAYALSQGITTAYNSMTQAEQATLRYNYLMSVSADAQGDFARTSDSLANQTRIAKLEIQDMASTLGTALMPTAQEAFGVLTDELSNLKSALAEGGTSAFFEQFGTSIANIIAYLAEKAPDFVGIGTQLIQSLIQGFINNYDRMSQSMQQIVASLISGYAAVIPMILQLGGMMLSDIIEGFIAWLPNLGATLTGIITTISEFIIANIPTLLQLGTTILVGLINGITEALPALFEYVPLIMQTIVSSIMENLPLIVNAALLLLQTLASGLVAALPELIPAVTGIIINFVQFIVDNLGTIISVGMDILAAVVQGIVAALPELITAAVNIIFDLVEYILDNIGTIIDLGLELILALVDGILMALPIIATRLPEIILKIVDTLVANLPKILQAGVDIIVALVNGIFKAVPMLLKNLPSILRSIVNMFSSLYNSMLSVGKNLLIGIWNGIADMASWFWRSIGNFLGDIVNTVKNFFGIASPSKLFRDEIGKNLVLGMSVGVETNKDEMENAMAGLMTDVNALAMSGINATSSAVLNGGYGQAVAPVSNIIVNEGDQHINFNEPIQSPTAYARKIREQRRFGLKGAQAFV